MADDDGSEEELAVWEIWKNWKDQRHGLDNLEELPTFRKNLSQCTKYFWGEIVIVCMYYGILCKGSKNFDRIINLIFQLVPCWIWEQVIPSQQQYRSHIQCKTILELIRLDSFCSHINMYICVFFKIPEIMTNRVW